MKKEKEFERLPKTSKCYKFLQQISVEFMDNFSFPADLPEDFLVVDSKGMKAIVWIEFLSPVDNYESYFCTEVTDCILYEDCIKIYFDDDSALKFEFSDDDEEGIVYYCLDTEEDWKELADFRLTLFKN